MWVRWWQCRLIKGGHMHLQYRLRTICNIIGMLYVYFASRQAWGHLGMALTSLEVNTDGNTIGMIEVGSGWVWYCSLQCIKSVLQYICGGCPSLALVEGKMQNEKWIMRKMQGGPNADLLQYTRMILHLHCLPALQFRWLKFKAYGEIEADSVHALQESTTR